VQLVFRVSFGVIRVRVRLIIVRVRIHQGLQVRVKVSVFFLGGGVRIMLLCPVPYDRVALSDTAICPSVCPMAQLPRL